MSPDEAIDRILELSAEVQTKRRQAAENSPIVHKLSGAILAYGESLNLLTKLRNERNCKQRGPGTAVAALGYSCRSPKLGKAINIVRVTMLQDSPHISHFKRLLDFGEEQQCRVPGTNSFLSWR